MKYLERFNIYGVRKKSKELDILYDLEDILRELDDIVGHDMVFNLRYEYPHYLIQITREQHDYFRIKPLVEYIQRILYYINLNNFVIVNYTIDLNPEKTFQFLYKDEYLDHRAKGGNWITFNMLDSEDDGERKLKAIDGLLLIDSDFIHESVPTLFCRNILIIFK